MPVTVRSGANQFNHMDITKYAVMLGGLDARHDSIKQWDPMITGYWRLFMVRKPACVNQYYKKGTSGTTRFDAYKHMLEYGNLGVSGIEDTTMDFTEITGGYTGKSLPIPTIAKNGTNRFRVKVEEMSGGLVHEIHNTWINAVADENGGLSHYNGLIASGDLAFNQANHTAEFIYVVTDRTGMKVEFAAHLCDCMPTTVPLTHYDSNAGEHDKVELDLEFTCVMYTGLDVNEKAALLLKRNQIMVNSIEWCTGLDASSGRFAETRGYNPKSGKIENMDLGSYTVGTGDDAVKYRTKINNSDASGTVQKIDTESLMMPTPSYTDIGSRL